MRFRTACIPAFPILLLTALTGCVSFPENSRPLTAPPEQLQSGVARIHRYLGHHPNNVGTGDYVAVVYLQTPLAGLGGEPLRSFELNFYVPRARPDGCQPAWAYQLQGNFHYSYFKESWRPLMRALSSGRPMYVKWDLSRLVADISADKTFATPQAWPPLQIDPRPSPTPVGRR